MKLPAGRLDFLLLHDSIAGGARVTVVTPNRRLATFFKREYDDAQRRLGRQAWDTADILPLETFLERAYRTLNLRTVASTPPPQLLNGIQCQFIWEELVRKSDERGGLMSVPQAAKQAFAAWQLAHEWRLFPALRSFMLHEDARIFMSWSQQYQKLCRERNMIDAAMLPDALMTLIPGDDRSGTLPTHLITAGFDIVTPQQQHFFDACIAAGVAVQSVNADADQQHVMLNRIEFADENEELRGCAIWARQRLEKNPRARIAIVMPDLRMRRGQIVRALTDALLPRERANVRTHHDEMMPWVNVSLGQPLSDFALVHDALALIEFSQGHAMSFLAFSALLRSPYVAGAETEATWRAALDAALREIAPMEMSLFSLQKKLKLASKPDPERAHLRSLALAVSHCEKLCASIDRVASLGSQPARPDGDSRQRPMPSSPQDWGRHFANVLRAWGFPGDAGLDSVEHQVLGKFRDALASLGTLQAVKPRMKFEEALTQLRRIVADTVFQPETSAGTGGIEPPIQVLGILESAGQQFDALWVTGLSDDAWPLAARPAPFIPAVLQRAAGVTEASASASLALDSRITDGWRNSAGQVVFSHALRASGHDAGEQIREPSALIRSIPLSSVADILAISADADFAAALQAIGAREAIPDANFEALPAPTAVRGGTSVIRDQAACPFRSFARHRLLARSLEVPHAGLDAAERGTLLHRVLSLVWGRIETHAGLLSLEDNQLDEIVNDAVARAIAEASANGVDGLIGRFVEIEHARLTRVIGEWLDYERERAPFEVVERERKRAATISGLSMNLRLDRLDRLADGTHALIDYKTGAAKFSSWLGNRPDEPQLPMYFISAEEPVSAMAFARLKRGERGKVFGFEGVSMVENLLPDVAPIEQKRGMEKNGYVSWDVLAQEWETSLDALAKGFARGAAQVDPKNGNVTCAQCDLQSVCRIAEMSAYAAMENGDVADFDGDPTGEGKPDE